MIELVKSPVIFREEDHTYWLGNNQLKGVTSTLIKRAYPNKYDGVAPEVLANAAKKGHELHALIEYHDQFGTNGEEHEDARVAIYDRLKREHSLKTIANEYVVSDNLHYASCIDLVMTDAIGDIVLADIKTTWNLDKESTALQLSIYKRFFELQNPGLKVKNLYAIWMPNRDYSLSSISPLREVDESIIDALIEADQEGREFDITTAYGDLPERIASVQDEVIAIVRKVEELKEREKELKEGLYEQMMLHDIKSFESEKLRLTRVLPTTSETFDSKRFKEERPDLYSQYVKTSKRDGSLKITIKNK